MTTTANLRFFSSGSVSVRLSGALVCVLAASACGGGVEGNGDASPEGATDAPIDTTRPPRDSGSDAGKPSRDGGSRDGQGADGPQDGTMSDSPTDARGDAPSTEASVDGGRDAGTDAGDGGACVPGPGALAIHASICPTAWCWSSPTPTGDDTGAFGGSSSSDVWLLPVETGFISHWDGTAWSSVPSGTTEVLTHVWSASAKAAWAVGDDGTIVAWDGAAWSVQTSPLSAALSSVWGTSTSDVWVGGAGGVAAHWDGTSWTSVAMPVTYDILSFSGTSSNDVWATGGSTDGYYSPGRGGILHWDGSTWTEVTHGAAVFFSVSADAANDAWAVSYHFNKYGGHGDLYHWDGTTWTPTSTTDEPLGVWAFSPTDVWVSDGYPGAMSHWDGSAWSVKYKTGYLEGEFAEGYGGTLLGLGPNDLWVENAPGGGFDHYDGCSWTSSVGAVSLLAYQFYEWGGVWASSPTDVWVAGYRRVAHFDGTSWSDAPGSAIYDETTPQAIWGTSSKDVWAVGGNYGLDAPRALHWNGSKWTTTAGLPTTVSNLESVSGSASNDVWAVGIDTSAYHWTGGSSWTSVTTPSAGTLHGVWVDTSTDAWAVGASGAVVHYDGTTWSSTPSGVTSNLNNAWGSGPSDVWAVGVKGTLIHWDGTSWTSVASGTSDLNLVSVSGTASNDVWVAVLATKLTDPQVLHWDGSTWTLEVAVPSTGYVFAPSAVYASTGAGVWFAGVGGGSNAFSSIIRLGK